MERGECLKFCIERWFPHLSVHGKYPNLTVFGSMIDVLDIIAEKLNICYEFVFTKDRVFGMQQNGTWNGLMGILVRGEANMSGVIFSVDHVRSSVVDFSEPLYVNEHILAYKRPVLQPDVGGFVRPFTISIWALLILSVVVVTSGIFLLQKKQLTIVSKIRKKTKMEAQFTEDGTWCSTFWTLGSLLAQSIPWEPVSLSIKFLAGTWLLMTLIVNTVYRSNLKAMLIMPRVVLPFDTMAELVESGIKTYVSPGSFILRIMMESPPGTTFYNFRQQMDLHLDSDLAIHNTATGKTAALIDTHTIQYVIETLYMKTKTCSLYIASETMFSTTSLSLAFPKGSELKRKVDPIIRSLRESGILNYLFHKQVPHAAICRDAKSQSVDSTRRALELHDFYGVFLVYGGGILLAVLCFIVELCLKANQRRQQG